jgi:hypothetical protein
MPILFEIEISKHHNIKGLARLLIKEVKHYKNSELVDFDGIDTDFESCDEIHIIPYDDYLIDDEKPQPTIFNNSDDFFDDCIKYQNTGCNVVLGFSLECKDIILPSKHMKKLLEMRDRLFREKRITGNFFFGRDCCT